MQASGGATYDLVSASNDLTQRLVDGDPASFDGETIVIGALDSYEARCRGCYQPGDDAAEAAGYALHSVRV